MAKIAIIKLAFAKSASQTTSGTAGYLAADFWKLLHFSCPTPEYYPEHIILHTTLFSPPTWLVIMFGFKIIHIIISDLINALLFWRAHIFS